MLDVWPQIIEYLFHLQLYLILLPLYCCSVMSLKTFSPHIEHIVRVVIQHDSDLVIDVLVCTIYPIKDILHGSRVEWLIIQEHPEDLELVVLGILPQHDSLSNVTVCDIHFDCVHLDSRREQ